MDKDLNRRTDEELILAFQSGNEEAYTVLVRRYKDPLMNYIYRFVGDYDECADILQDTFVRLYRKKHLYKSVAKFSTWLYTIAGNLARSELRRRSRKGLFSIFQSKEKGEEFELPLPSADPLPDQTTDGSLKAMRIQQALATLPDSFREAVILRDIQDLSYEEIAAILGLPIGTVKSRINRGRSQLQELLKDIYD